MFESHETLVDITEIELIINITTKKKKNRKHTHINIQN